MDTIPHELFTRILFHCCPESRVSLRQVSKLHYEIGDNNLLWFNLLNKRFNTENIYSDNDNYKNYYYYELELEDKNKKYLWEKFVIRNYSCYISHYNYEVLSIINRRWYQRNSQLEYDEYDIYDKIYLSTIDYKQQYYMKNILILFKEFKQFKNIDIPSNYRHYIPTSHFMKIMYGIRHEKTTWLDRSIYVQTCYESLYNSIMKYLHSGVISNLIIVDYIITLKTLKLLIESNINISENFPLEKYLVNNDFKINNRKVIKYRQNIIQKVKEFGTTKLLSNTMSLLQTRNFIHNKFNIIAN